MKILAGVLCAGVVAGCSAEVATTAATSAALKKQEVEAAQQTKALVQKKVDDAAKAVAQRAEQQGNADK